MKDPRAVEVVKSAINKAEWEVRGYWDGDNRAGQDVTFVAKWQANKWANEHGLVVCNRHGDPNKEYTGYSSETY